MTVGELTCKPCGLIFFSSELVMKGWNSGTKHGWWWKVAAQNIMIHRHISRRIVRTQPESGRTVMQCWEIYRMVLGLEVYFFCFQFVQLQPIWLLYYQVEKAISTSEWVPKGARSFHPADIVQKIIFVQTALCPGSTMGMDCKYHLALHMWICLQFCMCSEPVSMCASVTAARQ